MFGLDCDHCRLWSICHRAVPIITSTRVSIDTHAVETSEAVSGTSTVTCTLTASPGEAQAASAAAATQPTPAAGASGEVRSQVKNQAFPSFLILQASLRCPGLVYIPSPGSMSRCISKFFSQKTRVFIPKVARKPPARARCVNLWVENKNGRNLSFFTGVSEFDCWARGSYQGCRRSRPLGQGTFSGVFGSF